ncbi:hypothetical protein [Spirulina subsalsa]|uniref:hypothetical protein n=1 Tax=Spirulina subsalsa TaxID=54311 RepID=UPI000375B68F|nr:hypothetical protein [Spirulina subsalsa]
MKIIVILWTILCVIWLFASMGELDPSMVESSDAYAAGAGIGAVVIFIVWAVVTVPLSILGLLFKK